MSLRVPDVDDRSYPDLLQEGIALIPRYTRQWTNHNASDPGITLVELFAYLTESFIYRLNRVSDANRAKFLKLLTGEPSVEQDHEGLDVALREAALELRRPSRAITCEDFERIAREATAHEPKERQVTRARCFPRRDLGAPTAEERQHDRPGYTSVVFVCGDPWIDEETTQAVEHKLREYFEPRRLLTSRVRVCGPRYLDLSLRIRTAVLPGSSKSAVNEAASRELNRFFHPLHGGPSGAGWPFGRSVYASDVYRLFETLAGVDYVSAVEFHVSDAARLHRGEFGEVVEIQLQPDELVRVRTSDVDFDGPRKIASGGSSTW